MMPSPHQTCESPTTSPSPTLWLECLPSDLQIRIAQYVSEGKSGLYALNLAKSTPQQQEIVCIALDHTLKGTFASHAHGLASDWVDVFDDVHVLQLREHPPNIHLLYSPSLRHLLIEDEPLQLEALSKSCICVDELELTIRYNTPSYLVCCFLAEITFKTLTLCDRKNSFFKNLDPSDLVAACEGVETVIFDDHCWINDGVADFVTGLPSLRDLDVDIQGMGSLSEMLPVMRRLRNIRITAWDSQVVELIELLKQTGTCLTVLYVTSYEYWGDDHMLALSETIPELSKLRQLTIPLPYGAERSFPQIPSIKKLNLRWRGELELLENKRLHYKPNEGDILRMIENYPRLTALRMFDVRLSDKDVVSIIERLGSGLKEFGISIDAQDIPSHRTVLTVIDALISHTNDLQKLDLRSCYLYSSDGPYTIDELKWSVKQEMLLRLDRLHRQNPKLDIEGVESLIMNWPCEEESEQNEETEKAEETMRNTLTLRRCRRGMNERGDILYLKQLAGLLETGCEGLEQDLDAAIELYKQAVRMGDPGDAIVRLWDLTEKGSHMSSKSSTGGALELMLEMDRKKEKTLPHFADMFHDGAIFRPPRLDAAEKVLELAVNHGYMTPCAMKLAALVEKGYDDRSPDPARAVDLYRCVIDDCEDKDALFCLAHLLNKGYANEPPNPAEARKFLERGVKKRCCRSMNLLGKLIQNGYEGVEPNPKAAIAMFQQAVDHGNQEAMIHLGVLCAEGREFFPANPGKAVELLKKAVDKDRSPVALRHLGILTETGYDDHTPNPKRAVELYEEAILCEDMCACINLAKLVARGYEDVPPDQSEAIRLYKQVIETGSIEEQAEALRNYACLDIREARLLYNKIIAEAHGDQVIPEAMYALADILGKEEDHES